MRKRTAVRKIVEELGLGVRITPNQDLLLCHIPGARRGRIEQLLAEHGVKPPEAISRVRKPGAGLPGEAHMRPGHDRRGTTSAILLPGPRRRGARGCGRDHPNGGLPQLLLAPAHC